MGGPPSPGLPGRKLAAVGERAQSNKQTNSFDTPLVCATASRAVQIFSQCLELFVLMARKIVEEFKKTRSAQDLPAVVVLRSCLQMSKRFSCRLTRYFQWWGNDVYWAVCTFRRSLWSLIKPIFFTIWRWRVWNYTVLPRIPWSTESEPLGFFESHAEFRLENFFIRWYTVQIEVWWACESLAQHESAFLCSPRSIH